MNPFIFLLTRYRPKLKFGKVITLINSDWKAMLDSEKEQLLNQFLNQVVLIVVFNYWKSLVGSYN